MNMMNTYLKGRRDLIFVLLLIIFHSVGIFLMTSAPAEGAKLSYVNLLLCGIVVFWSEGFKKKSLLPLFVISVGGYTLELIGIHTQLLFGDYVYGNALGIKLFEVPIIIGLNWYIIVLVSANITRLLKMNLLFSSLFSGLFCVFLDVLIEPVAIRLDYWSWTQGVIPIYNYVCWFIFSVLFSFIYLRTAPNRNLPAQFLFGIWAMFFTILNLA